MPSLHRRHLLSAALGAAPLASLSHPRSLSSPALQDLTGEDFWAHVQAAFTVDRSMVNFNNGGVSPAPRGVQDALQRHLDHAHQAPAYTMWRLQDPQRETVRSNLARHFGVHREEVAIMRNASEALQTVQFGLDFQPGDVVLASSHDYPRMLSTFRQRERREGLRLVEVEIPVPLEDPQELVSRYERAMDEHRPKLVLVSHVVFLTGQILPVRDIVRAARKRGILTLVDGAHSFGHFPFTQEDLDCDLFATSLHKWMHGPLGTGFLYVRRDLIGDIWPLMAAEESEREDIRKFEQIGTHPVGVRLAIADALAFYESIGPARKAARLVELRNRWAQRVQDHPRVRFQTNIASGQAGAIATVGIDGVVTNELQKHLWITERIYTVAIRHANVDGLRVSPSIYATLSEVDRFTDAFERVLNHGIPS